MTRDQIKQRVLIAIDEVSNTEFSNINLETQIDAFLDECAQQIVYLTPNIYFDNKVSFISNDHECDSEGRGWVKLPENTVRVTSFKIEDWENEVNFFFRTDSETHRLQSNPYLRGGTKKPIVSVDSNKLYYFSAKKPVNSLPKILIAEAITELSADEDFPEKFIPSLVWLCASKTLQVMNETEASDLALAQFNNTISIFK